MTVLLYGILRSEEAEIRDLPCGIGAQPLLMASTKKLAAVTSQFERTGEPVDVADAMAYHEVIASIHRKRTVIPIRFGTVFDQALEILRLLEVKEEKYCALLDELDGQVELGVKLISSLPRWPRYWAEPQPATAPCSRCQPRRQQPARRRA